MPLILPTAEEYAHRLNVEARRKAVKRLWQQTEDMRALGLIGGIADLTAGEIIRLLPVDPPELVERRRRVLESGDYQLKGWRRSHFGEIG